MSKRINVTVSDSLKERIDNYADEYGMGQSSIVAFIVGQWFDRNDQQHGNIEDSVTSDSTLTLILRAVTELKKKEDKNELLL